MLHDKTFVLPVEDGKSITLKIVDTRPDSTRVRELHARLLKAFDDYKRVPRLATI